ncbi:MAG TPA: hypothetical protein VGV38_14320 [Pyrinomonadaceae bacterium]|nr:hypothetical protein [Pyrinomonadaceae bacterium]
MKVATAALLVVAGAGAALLLGAGVLSVVRRGGNSPAQAAQVPLFRTPSWATFDEEEIDRELKKRPGQPYQPTPRPQGSLLVRRESAGAGALLLRHTMRETLYRYDPAARALTQVGAEAWERAVGPVAECARQFAPPESKLALDQKADRLRAAGGREVATAGRVPLALVASPSGRWVAVLSADGPKKGSLMPFSGDTVLGRRLQQVLSLPAAAAVGSPVVLPVLNEGDVPVACWSADEQFIVYHDYNFYSLSVVETHPPPTPHP